MDRFNKAGWTNRTWSNMSIRRAYVDVVDDRKQKDYGWHISVYFYDKKWRTIYGFDIIAGKKKITGAFFDFFSLLKKSRINKMVYRRK